MNANKNATFCRKIIGDALKPIGFKKIKNTWYLQKKEIILVANLQKSSYSVQFYINFGIWIKLLGENEFPSVNICHIQRRMEEFISKNEKDFNKFLDFENEFTLEKRTEEIKNAMTTFGIPFLESCSTLTKLKEEFKKNVFENALVFKEVNELFAK